MIEIVVAFIYILEKFHKLKWKPVFDRDEWMSLGFDEWTISFHVTLNKVLRNKCMVWKYGH